MEQPPCGSIPNDPHLNFFHPWIRILCVKVREIFGLNGNLKKKVKLKFSNFFFFTLLCNKLCYLRRRFFFKYNKNYKIDPENLKKINICVAV